MLITVMPQILDCRTRDCDEGLLGSALFKVATTTGLDLLGSELLRAVATGGLGVVLWQHFCTDFSPLHSTRLLCSSAHETEVQAEPSLLAAAYPSCNS